MGLSVRLGGFAGVMHCVGVVAVRRVRMMCGFFVIPGLVVLRSFFMVSGSVLVMLRGLMMMLCGFLRHNSKPSHVNNDLTPNCEEHIGCIVTAHCQLVELIVKTNLPITFPLAAKTSKFTFGRVTCVKGEVGRKSSVASIEWQPAIVGYSGT